MRSLLSLAAIVSVLISTHAIAGTNGCTGTSDLSWSQDNPYETLLSTDCIIDAAQSDSGGTSLLSYLTPNPSDTDQFTLVDTTAYALDQCDNYYSDPGDGGDGNTYSYCMPAGFGFEAAGTSQIGDPDNGYSQSLTLSEFYFTACEDPGSSPCTPTELPGYYADYPKQRYRLAAQFDSPSGNWIDSDGPALFLLRIRQPLPKKLLKIIRHGRKGIIIP